MNSAESLESLTAFHVAGVGEFLDRHFHLNSELLPGHRLLLASMRYSLLQKGSKRFRPVLAGLTARALSGSTSSVTAFAAAVECVHTYSLIHDDLPAMDDDDVRRGEPTNHKAFGEATAILAGDALLTEAFTIISEHYKENAEIAIRLIQEVAQAAGAYGMVGGQAIDIATRDGKIDLPELRYMHSLKTGALIRVSAVGSAIVCQAREAQLDEIKNFSGNLGLAFQIADDLLDYDPQKPEPGSYPTLLGAHKARAYLDEITAACISSLGSWPSSGDPLRALAVYNRDRTL